MQMCDDPWRCRFYMPLESLRHSPWLAARELRPRDPGNPAAERLSGRTPTAARSVRVVARTVGTAVQNPSLMRGIGWSLHRSRGRLAR